MSTATVDRLLARQTRGRASTPAVSIALLPLDDTPTVARFAAQLTQSCARLSGGAHRVDAADARVVAGEDFDRGRLASWSNDLENEYELVVYVAETEPTPWTESCLRQADLVVVVADATTGAPRSAWWRAWSTVITARIGARSSSWCIPRRPVMLGARCAGSNHAR